MLFFAQRRALKLSRPWPITRASWLARLQMTVTISFLQVLARGTVVFFFFFFYYGSWVIREALLGNSLRLLQRKWVTGAISVRSTAQSASDGEFSVIFWGWAPPIKEAVDCLGCCCCCCCFLLFWTLPAPLATQIY
jgi:hypothetical protein